MKKLDAEELKQALQAAPGWELAGGKLEREWTFPDFVEAMKFVNRVAEIAEEADHHPDIDVRYNRVKLGLVTHSAGGITARDATMAARMTREL
ncbi:MAG: 4a-hydroxytetrahydrobiopterin dehydratase [Acidobacteriota bacterium]|nr:4a-hydroxytetrahydrobiopterin dehydratase [Acidobacteriota bacterium]